MHASSSTAYTHTQIGYVTGGVGLAGLCIIYYSFMAEYGELGPLAYAMLGLFGVFTALFATLTTEVRDGAFRFYFGPGFWTRQFPLHAIERVTIVQNRVYYGWGIRYTSHGWLYTVSGLQAVELEVRGEGTIRVGSDEPEQLKRALDAARHPTPTGE